jgi:hypothetical protein
MKFRMVEVCQYLIEANSPEEVDGLLIDHGPEISVEPPVTFVGVTRRTIKPLNETEVHPPGRPPVKRREATRWLRTYLIASGSQQAGRIIEEAEQAGISVHTLHRAAKDIGVVKDPAGGGPTVHWFLPDEKGGAA